MKTPRHYTLCRQCGKAFFTRTGKKSCTLRCSNAWYYRNKTKKRHAAEKVRPRKSFLQKLISFFKFN